MPSTELKNEGSQGGDHRRTTARRGPKSHRRFVLFAAVTVLGSTVLAYYVCEAVYRWSKYRQLQQFSKSQPDIVTELPVDRFDEQTGFSYRPNTRTRFRKLGEDGELLVSGIELRINNLGHISHHDDSVEKPPGEFRIALLGDSMTAAWDMRQPWPDMLETLLNEDRRLANQLSVSRFKVINFAQDGIGVVQCGKIHEHRVREYDVDLVVLNFIEEDIPRRLVYRTPLRRDLPEMTYYLTVHTYTLPCSPDNPDRFFGTVSASFDDYDNLHRRVKLMEDIALIRRGQIRWTSPYPELFAERGGHRIGVAPRLFNSVGHSHYNDQEAIEYCAQACQKIVATSSSALFLCMPGGPEAGDPLPPGVLPPLTQRLGEEAGISITPMSRFLPLGENEGEHGVNNPDWYIPGDGHLNDLGGEIYAAAMKRRLEQFLTGEN